MDSVTVAAGLTVLALCLYLATALLWPEGFE